MNLELNGYKITLGPKALAHVETAYRAKGEYLDQCAAIYCRDQLELWRAGGKVDADVTVTGPARFVAVGNEIGIPAIPTKAGAEARERGSLGPGSAEPLPVASAAPADLYEPVGTMPVVGDVVEHIRDRDRHTITAIFAAGDTDELWRATHGGHKHAVMYQPKIAPAWRILKRPAHGLQVWRAADRCIWIFDGNGVSLARLGVSGSWCKSRIGRVWPSDALVTGPEADAAIKEARAQGVL